MIITLPNGYDTRVEATGGLVSKTPWRDGTTHLVISPLEFMQRLASLVPKPDSRRRFRARECR